jgi:hypothetical protein
MAANTDPQAIRIANEKIRVCADRLGQLYNLSKADQAEATAKSWLSLFPATNDLIDDGSATDGRAPITNQDVRDFVGDVSAFLTWAEAGSNVIRNRALKIAVNPEKIG